MKKIKLLLIALCGVLCAAVTACDLAGMTGGSSSITETTSMASDTQTEETSSISKEEEQSESNEEDTGVGENSDVSEKNESSVPDSSQEPENSEELESTVPDSSEDPNDGEDDNIPAGKMMATVYFYTIHTDEGVHLSYSGLVDKDATLNDFFAEHMEGIKEVYNHAHGYTDPSEYYYQEDFFRESFWQIGTRLQYGDSVLSASLPANTKTFNINWTGSGMGMTIGICVCEDPLNPDWMDACMPFPVEVCIEDFVNWMHTVGAFEMPYSEAITKGYFVEAGYTERLDSTYTTGSNMLCFVYGNGDVVDPFPTEFTVYMPTVYGYDYSEMGELNSAWGKDGLCTVPAGGITVRDAYNFCYGGDPDYTFNYYMDGVQVSEDTLLTKECAVVCVDTTQDVALPEFTLTVYIEGGEKISYNYTRPVAMRDAIAKYCAANNLKMSDYTWTEKESQMASFDINTAWVRDIEIYGYIYVEPEKPTSRKIHVMKYDGVEETTATYEIGLDMNAGDFIRAYLSPDFDDENIQENEYTFFMVPDSPGSSYWYIYGFDSFYEYEFKILMLKTSVLEAGYTVDLDITFRGGLVPEIRTVTYHMPMSLSGIIQDLGWSYYIDWTTYQITVDGKVLDPGDSEKIFAEYEINPHYKNVSVKMRPIYQVHVDVCVADEGDKSKKLTFYGDVTLPMIVEELGLKYTYRDYAWKINWSSDYFWTEDGCLYERLSEYQIYLVVEARKVYTNFTFVNQYGDEMTFGSEYDFYNAFSWDWSVNVKTAFETMVGTGEDMDAFDDFTWIAKGPNGEFEVTADTVLNYIIPEMYDHYDNASNYRTVYSLIGTRKTVTVSVFEQGMDGETEKGTKIYPTTVTIADILAEYGYTNDGNIWFMVSTLYSDWSNNFPNDWQWDTIVTWPIKITVYRY